MEDKEKKNNVTLFHRRKPPKPKVKADLSNCLLEALHNTGHINDEEYEYYLKQSEEDTE